MNTGGAQPGIDLSCIGVAVEVEFAGKVATPTDVSTEEQARELAELGLAPFEVKVQRY